jgi:hypothetical protein
MRKIAILLVAIAMGLTTAVSAKKLPTVAAKLPATLKDIITKNLDYPNDARLDLLEGNVWMKVCVTGKSKIKVVDISSTTPELGVYVKKELSSLYVDNPGCDTGQVYYLKIKFDLIMK